MISSLFILFSVAKIFIRCFISVIKRDPELFIVQNKICHQNTFTGETIPVKVSSVVKTKNAEMMDYLDILSSNSIAGINMSKSPVDIPIRDKQEFDEIFKRICEVKKKNGDPLWFSPYNYMYYKKANDVELGLLPYCGEHDKSCLINMYLSKRLENPEIRERWEMHLPEDEKSFVDVVRVLDYSLKNLDKEFGKYKGIVYRQGYMGEDVGQFFSTSMSPSIVCRMGNRLEFKPDAGYSVIRTNNGHNIYEFQKKMGTEYAKTEEEILLPRKGKYLSVKEEDLDEELSAARDMLASRMFCGADLLVAGKIPKSNGYTKEDLYSFINVFDEIKG